MITPSNSMLLVAITGELVAYKSSDSVSFLSDRIWRPLVVEIDEKEASSSEVLIVGDSDELLIQVILLDVEGIDVRDSGRSVSHRTPCFDSYVDVSAMDHIISMVALSTHSHAGLSRALSV